MAAMIVNEMKTQIQQDRFEKLAATRIQREKMVNDYMLKKKKETGEHPGGEKAAKTEAQMRIDAALERLR